MVMSDLVLYEVIEGVAKLTLNRPTALNALNNDMISDLISYLKEAERDDDVRVILIQGNGRSFCAGDDLIDMGTQEHPNPDDKLQEYKMGYPEIVLQIRSVEKPVIAKIHGYALGAGFEIALAADIVISAEEAKVGLPFVLRGIAAGSYLLQSIVGYHKACELLFTGDMLSAEKAEQMGIINKVVPLDQLEVETDRLTRRLSKGATRAIGLMKLAMNNTINEDVKKGMHEQVYTTTYSYYTKDYAEGKNAFIEKREPNFLGK
jgi:2-(1,2-epoxy-1,2-dihydrophenyl)acetyl-CoA isomerase